MSKILAFLAESPVTQAAVTLVIYSFYATVMGVSLAPSVLLLYQAWNWTMIEPTFTSVLLFSVFCGAAVYLYFITGVLVMGCTVRIISLGIKPGKYPFVSLTMLRWMVYSGVYHMAISTILCYVPMSFLGNLFFRIFGAKIGKNVRLNTWYLNDAYLLEIGDNVVVGGKTDISCHTIEPGRLILQPVKIGADTLIGQRCYLSPGVTVGERCIIGQYAFLRKNTVVPDRGIISAIAGLPIRQVSRIERPSEGMPGRDTMESKGE